MAETPGSSEKAKGFAERFGMTPDAVERVMTATHGEYSAVAPPASDAPEVPIAFPPVKKPQAGGGITAAILVALFVALGVAMSFRHGCFEQRNQTKQAVKPVDTVQAMLSKQAQAASTPPDSPTDVPPGDVPPEALVVPREEPPGTSGAPSNSGPTTMSEAERASEIDGESATTSSNFEAQERLAELRAEGKTSAHLGHVKKHGVTNYKVYER